MKGLHIFDAEANGLLDELEYFHCFVFKEYAQKKFYVFLNTQHEEFEKARDYTLARAKDAEVAVEIRDFSELRPWLTTVPRAIAGHNIFGYDLRAMKQLLGLQYDMFADPKCMGTLDGKQVSLFDTLSMSRTLYPDRPLPRGCPDSIKNPVTGKNKKVGPHGLESWGMRVANKKVAIDDWRGLPLWKYVERCWEDVVINELVWKALVLEASGKDNADDAKFYYTDKPVRTKRQMINWKNALRRGMLTDYLMIEQEIQGVDFDEEGARELVVIIDKMMKDIEDEVEPQLPKKELSKSQQPTFPAKPFKEGDGSISSHGWNWLRKLEYPINEEAFEVVAPPATAFKQDGTVGTAGKNYCIKLGCEDEEKMPDFIRLQLHKKNTLKPLPDDLMEKAIWDLRNGTMPDIMVPMRIGNQDDIKKYLIRDAGWLPTIWGTKDATKDQFKKQRPDSEVDAIVAKYVDDLDTVEYRDLILKFVGLTPHQFKDKQKMFKFFRRKARKLPTSPKLKDERGALCVNLEEIDGHLAKQIVKWLSLRNRRSVLDPIKEDKVDTGLLNHPRLKVDGKLPARFSGITNTGRRKHTVCANMPKPDPKVLLGKEMRRLWRAPKGKYQVGIDGSNLEGMIAAWGAYDFDGGEYLRIMESGDAHARNAEAYTKASGVTVTRNGGKGITYG